MNQRVIGMVALGSSNADNLRSMRARMPATCTVIGSGTLDDMTQAEIDDLTPRADEKMLVCTGPAGKTVPVSFQRIAPIVQQRIEQLESEGAELITVLCGTNWGDTLSAGVPLITPGAFLPQMVVNLAREGRLGVVLPAEEQVTTAVERYRELGGKDVVGTHAVLDDPGLSDAQRAAIDLASQNVDIVYLPCLSMGDDRHALFRSVLGKPTLLAQSMLAKVITELAEVS